MRNLQYYKRILAGVVCATLLLSNLGMNSQVVFAAENSDVNPNEITIAEPIVEAPAEEPAVTGEVETETPVVEEPASEPPVEETSDEDEEVVYITEYGAAGDDSHTGESSGEATTEHHEVTEESGSAGSTETTSEETSNQEETKDETGESASEGKTEHSTEETTEDEELTEEERLEKERLEQEELEKKQLEEKELEEEEEIEEIVEDGSIESLISYRAHTSGITVKAEAKSGVLPENATLHATRIESSRQLDEITATLDESDVTYDDYIALDVHFENAEGHEIEPDGTVSVTFEVDEIPAEANTSTLEVQHFDESGHTTDVVTVADTTDRSDIGDIQVHGADNDDVNTTAKVDFEVASFSTFTITWSNNKRGNSKRTMNVTVRSVDENGNELSGSKNWWKDTTFDSKEEKTVEEIAEIISVNGDYELKGAELIIDGTTYKDVAKVEFETSNTTWTCNITNTNGEKENIKDLGDANATSPSSVTLNLIYQAPRTRTDFYVILNGDGTIPDENSKDNDDYNYNYTLGIQVDNVLAQQTNLYDATVSEDRTYQFENKDNSYYSYNQNRITNNLQSLPTNAQIAQAINDAWDGKNKKGEKSGYRVSVDQPGYEGQLYVVEVNKDHGTIINDQKFGEIRVGDILYVDWYVQKYTTTEGATGGKSWHIDGEMIVANRTQPDIVITGVDTGTIPWTATLPVVMIGAVLYIIYRTLLGSRKGER